jgi:hypothetical protein
MLSAFFVILSEATRGSAVEWISEILRFRFAPLRMTEKAFRMTKEVKTIINTFSILK